MIYKSSKRLLENYEECEIFTSKYTENVKGKSEWIAKKGTHFKKPKKPPIAKTIAKCVVEYRPSKDWEGEFGIDWPRKNDSKMAVDIPYNGIIGKYGSIYATQPTAVFTKDNKAYTNHLNQYDTFNC